MLEDSSQQTMNEPVSNVHILFNLKHNTAPNADIVHIFSQINTIPMQKSTKVPKRDKRCVLVLWRGALHKILQIIQINNVTIWHTRKILENSKNQILNIYENTTK